MMGHPIGRQGLPPLYTIGQPLPVEHDVSLAEQ